MGATEMRVELVTAHLPVNAKVSNTSSSRSVRIATRLASEPSSGANEDTCLVSPWDAQNVFSQDHFDRALDAALTSVNVGPPESTVVRLLLPVGLDSASSLYIRRHCFDTLNLMALHSTSGAEAGLGSGSGIVVDIGHRLTVRAGGWRGGSRS